MIIALQSQGTNWGNNGIQGFFEDYFNSGHIVDCFTFIFDTKLTPALATQPTQTISFFEWANVWKWFMEKWGKTVSAK
jgi:hypothetical protein